MNYKDWVKVLIGGDALPPDVSCEGDCRNDPICKGCADGSIESEACIWSEGWEP